jgi:small-conductance mechanosensitive channel
VENTKYLRVLSDVTEKVKLRFDEEGISIAIPQRNVHLAGAVTAPQFQGFGKVPEEVHES